MPPLRSWPALTGWRRRTLAFALGICATLTLAPFYAFPLIIPAYGGLFLLVEATSTRRQAFLDGWWWGWGFFISGLYWFCIALLTDAEKFAWAIPFALFGLTGVIAIYPAVACALYRSVKVVGRATRLYLFALVWLVIEWVRGHILSGFPWNLAGYGFGFSEASLQLASVLGAYGLTFFTVLLGVSVAHRRMALLAWGAFAVALAWGQWRVQGAGEGEPTGAVLRVVQGNIAQHYKWDPQLQHQGLETYIALTQRPGLARITHVIWPETATPYALRSDTPLSHHLGEMLPEGKILITGALRIAQGQGDFEIFNSLVALDHNGAIIGSYDKHRLVPFGEFLPLRFLIPKGWKSPVGDKDFSRGEGVKTLDWQGLPPLSALICYEAIFPGLAAAAERPHWLLTVTNDAWFGTSTGPYQHFQMARMRAVEQGLPLVRAGNTGISAYIDEFGRIRDSLPLNMQGVMDFQLHKSQLYDTTYTRFGNIFLLVLICAGVFLGIRQAKSIKN